MDVPYLHEFPPKFADLDKLGLILIRPDGHIALRALPNKDNKNILTNYFEEIGFLVILYTYNLLIIVAFAVPPPSQIA